MRLFSTALLLALAATAQAGLPTLNYTCPGNIHLHTDEGGPAYINGNQAKLHKINDNTFDVSGGGVTVSIGVNPDGSASVMYTGPHGANGICHPEHASHGTSAPAKHPAQGAKGHAEEACRKAVAHQFGGKVHVKDIRVLGSEASQAGTSVRVSVPGAQAPWNCVIDTDGSVSRVEYGAEG